MMSLVEVNLLPSEVGVVNDNGKLRIIMNVDKRNRNFNSISNMTMKTSIRSG